MGLILIVIGFGGFIVALFVIKLILVLGGNNPLSRLIGVLFCIPTGIAYVAIPLLKQDFFFSNDYIPIIWIAGPFVALILLRIMGFITKGE